MILRRLSQALKQQNWTAIWIEFILLVAGVFLGIQVSNWNEDRANQKLAKILTERLRADLKIEAWSYEFQIQYYQEVLSNAEKALDVLEGRSKESNEQFLISAYRATQYSLPSRRRATYDEMTSTGTISLITNPQLRDASSLIYTNPVLDGVFNETLGSRYRAAFRMYVPMNVQSAVADQCGDKFVTIGNFKELKGSIDYPCSTGLTQDAIDNAANILRTDDSIVPLLRFRIADIKTIISNWTITNQDSRNSLKAIVGDKP
jgi:hypothetical protein